MTSPRNSNIKDDDNNNNQEDNMRELIVTQTQLNQVTAQFIANTSEVDPTMQRFLETQNQLLHKVTDQMINMGNNSSKGVCDNKDDKDVILEGTQACNICGDKDHTSKEHEDHAPIVKRNIQQINAPHPKLLVSYVKEIIMSLSNAPSIL